jgi:2-keto-4-pentenoate hydratase/2-oxohepta-3-ene-1,7-dioic acid hydratase in catechol pathway
MWMGKFVTAAKSAIEFFVLKVIYMAPSVARRLYCNQCVVWRQSSRRRFMGTTSVQNPGEPILLPRHLHSDQVDYECELAVVIGRDCKNVSVEDALDYVLGYTCANDVSARDWQKNHGGGQWVKGKSFDTFCPLGPILVTADRIPNPQILPIRTILNGQIRQESFTGDMIFSVAEIIAFLSGSTTLQAGTVILTGTPPGVGVAADPPRFLNLGDEVVIEITGIGRMQNSVKAESQVIQALLPVIQ